MWRQIIWQRSGGHYLFYTGALYFLVGMYCIFINNFVPVWLAQLVWIAILCLPFAIPPLGRWLNMSIDWDNSMFDFFRRKTAKEYMDEASNVYNLPKPTLVTPVEPPKEPEKPVTAYYRLGITNNGRVSFQMGYSEITMNAGGIDNMIEQLEVFRDQILQYEDNGPEDDPDGGEPVPVPENKQKAA